MRANGPTSLAPPLHVSLISLKIIFLLARPSHASQRRAAISPPHSTFSTAATSPYVCHPTRRVPHTCALAPCFSIPTHAVERAARLYWCWWCRRVPQVGPHRAKGIHERGRAGSARVLPLRVVSHSEAGIKQPWPLPPPMLQMYVSTSFSPYVANVCFKCLRCYQMHIASVLYGYYKNRSGYYICCKCYRACCKVFRGMFKRLFKIFHLF
jgi:hypothetical protein